MMNKFLLTNIVLCSILLLTMASDFHQDFNVPRKHNANINYTRILNFWTEHRNKLVFHGEHKEVVLVMGNTGSGKTTLALALTGRKLRVVRRKGYLVFVDEESRIGTGSSSQTLIPEAIFDAKRNVTYIDCSGFQDNRNVEYEISSIYFQNILMNQIEKIKLILVINYESLKDNGNKNDFDDLLDHISEFIKDISKFYDGIALVATKVENTYQEADDGTFFLSNSNEIVLNGIADYLKEKKDIYRSKTENLEKFQMFTDLIDILLQKDKGSHTRLAIFRQPTREGLLENLKATNNEINSIAKIVAENLHFVKKEKGDFGYGLSKSSKDIVDQIVADIFKNALTNRLYQMGNETLTHYLQIEKQFRDIEILRERVSLAYHVISGITKADEPLTFFRAFLNSVNFLNISTSLTNLNTISDDIKKLQFFTTVSNSDGEIYKLLLKNGAQHIVESVKGLKTFYDFLNYLQTYLDTYDSQNLKNDDRIKNVIRAIESSSEETVENIRDFKNVVKETGSDEIYQKTKTLKLNRNQLTHLKAVFEVFLTKLEFSCTQSSGEMTVKGYNVRISDVVKHSCWRHAKNIRIFALNKIFIDCTIDKTGAEGQLSIFGPTWEIVGGSKIILDGKPGESHQSAFAPSSNFTSENGRNGSPGLPGGVAGNFFGVGKRFINSEHLEIHANGGKGGPGQHGGNGADGIAGEGLSELFFETERNPEEMKKYFEEHNYKYSLTVIEDTSYQNTNGFQMGTLYLGSKYIVQVFGKPAQRPTDGGDGGVGGKGGYPGRIVINGLGSLVHVKTLNNSGITGLTGQNGHGGKKTSEGRRVEFNYMYDTSVHFFTSHIIEYRDINWMEGAEISAGKDGQPGRNTNGKRFPTNTTTVANPYFVINSFKNFVRMNLFKNIKESALSSFIYELETDDQIKKQYDTLAFVKELEGLENQFLELRNKIDFVLFYDSLLTRIEEFATTQKVLENKKVLSYIYTAALTKLFTLKKKRKGKTVVNLYKYLSTIETGVKEIRDTQHLKIVQSYRNDYENILRTKIREVNDFIKNKIEPEIDKLWEESDHQIKAIIDEIKQKRNSTEDAITSLEKKRAKIREIIQLRMMLLPLKLSASALSFFGPVGAGVGAVLTSSTAIAEGMLLDSTSGQGQNKIYSLDPNLKVMSRVAEVYNNKPQQLADKLSEVIAKLERHKEELSITQEEKIEISRKIGDLKAQVDEVKNRKATQLSDIDRRDKDTKRIQKILNEFLNSRKDLLEKEKKQLDAMKPERENAEKLKKEIKMEKPLRRINDAQSVLNSAEVVFNFVKKFENDEGVIRNIKNQIFEYAEELRNLENLEDQVYDVVIPDLRQVEKTVDAIKASVNGSSHAKLDLTKWTVRSTLRDVKSLLQKFTHKMSFELKSNLKRYMDKIDEGFSILIDIYDRIDSYSDSVKQAEYMAHIVSKPMTDVQVTNSDLSDAIIDLKFIIQSNILFEKYGTALHAFKQHYFPFAAHVLQKFQLPTDMGLNDSETLKSNIIETIKDMKIHIDETQATIGEYSKFAHDDNVFNSNTTGSSPFYIWKYDTIKDEVRQLLNGSEIIIKSDITKGLNYNSVKYTDIGLNFKLKNENRQKDFTSTLKNFALTMTMVGNNYYRCGERYYSVSFDDDISISYTLNQDDGKNWINPNEVYTTIRDSHPFLSPYGMWSIKLQSVSNNPEVSFDHLKLFTNETIDLELIGRGYYIKQDPDFSFNICNEYLDEFYNVENVAREL